MTQPTEYGQTSPLRFSLQGKSIVVEPLRGDGQEAMLRFAGGLPGEDLLFLDRDITQPAVIEQWIKAIASGSLFTVLARHDHEIVGYATIDRGNARWTQHVVELRVVVAESVRGLGIGRLLLELVFEKALEMGVTKLVARMTPDQTGARNLFKRLGFDEEAVLRDHAMDANGLTHDLLVLCYLTKQHVKDRCASCGVPVLTALSLDGMRLCSHCYELRYDELGGGD